MQSESEISVSQSSEYSDQDPDQFDLKDIYAYLLHEHEKFASVLEQYHKLEENNILHESTDGHELLEFKTRFLNYLRKKIRTQYPQQWCRFSSHVQLDVKRILKEDVENLKALLIKKKRMLQEKTNHLAEMEKQIENINKMADNFDSLQMGQEKYSLRVAAEEQKKKFVRSKEQLQNMLTELFPMDVKDLLQELCEAYFSDDVGDPYISVDVKHKYIEMLLEANIATRHPHVAGKIRLTNFFE